MTSNTAPLDQLLRGLKLPTFVAHRTEIARQAEVGNWTFERYLATLVEVEASERSRKRVDRLRRQSHLPEDKTLATLNLDLLPPPVRRMLPSLCEGGFSERAENILAFGLPGRGKTHLVAAIGHELVQRGVPVLFVATYALVQRLLEARRTFSLEATFKQLDTFAVVILDDIGYVQQNRDEIEVLFTFLAERYERRSVIITSNLTFSQWDRIFKDPMTTAAAIDRVVHHAVIVEMVGESVRETEARARQKVANVP